MVVQCTPHVRSSEVPCASHVPQVQVVFDSIDLSFVRRYFGWPLTGMNENRMQTESSRRATGNMTAHEPLDEMRRVMYSRRGIATLPLHDSQLFCLKFFPLLLAENINNVCLAPQVFISQNIGCLDGTSTRRTYLSRR